MAALGRVARAIPVVRLCARPWLRRSRGGGRHTRSGRLGEHWWIDRRERLLARSLSQHAAATDAQAEQWRTAVARSSSEAEGLRAELGRRAAEAHQLRAELGQRAAEAHPLRAELRQRAAQARPAT